MIAFFLFNCGAPSAYGLNDLVETSAMIGSSHTRAGVHLLAQDRLRHNQPRSRKRTAKGNTGDCRAGATGARE
jgi:hypothetical protein